MTNDFKNPVGSVSLDDYQGISSTQDNLPQDDSGVYQVIGRGGSVRHQGVFSSANPYLEQLKSANKNQDKDALYELAVQWEADYANRQQQLAENRAILEEQREYDNPVNQVARQRAAGINPDIAGSSSSGSTSSGSSAQLTNPGLADQNGQTKFSNKYDNTSQVFDGINTAANFISSLTGSVSGIMNSVSSLKMLPSQISLNEAQAGLQGAQANEIKELLSGKKKSLDLTNASQSIQNSSAILEQLASFADLISPDTEDFSSILSSLGVSSENISPYTDIIKQMHANPVMREKYAKASTAAKFSEAENDIYTNEIVSGMVEVSQRTEQYRRDLEYHRTNLEKRISSLLDTDDFAESSAELEIGQVALGNQSVGVQSKELELQLQSITHDLEAFAAKLQFQAEGILMIDESMSKLREQAAGRSMTPWEAAMYNKLSIQRKSLYSLASSEFGSIQGYIMDSAYTMADRFNRLDDKGNLIGAHRLELGNMFLDSTFNDFIQHTRTKGEQANLWVSPLIQGLGIGLGAGIGAAATHRFKPSKWRKTITSYNPQGYMTDSKVEINRPF